MKNTIAGFVSISLILNVLAVASVGQNNTGKERGPASNVQRFLMNPYHANIGTITEVAANGTVRVGDIANPRFALNRRLAGRVDLTEGYYLGLVADEFVVSTKDTRLVRCEVINVGTQGTATLRISSEAAKKIVNGDQIVFFRPPGSTTSELKAAPDYAPVDDGTATSALGEKSVNVARSLSRSQINLKQLGLALHAFDETYNSFPPAVVYGPDGKPWHSWRVLILPFIEEQAVYDRYRFDEPWNGPNNRKLLAEMPAIFQDPIYGETGDFFTHYAAATGEGTAFPTEGLRMTKKTDRPLDNLAKSKGVSSVAKMRDGTSNTIMVGLVSPDRQIPWMKPEDVVIGDDFARLGEKTSFATPYGTRGSPATLFLFGDGSVRTIPASIDMQLLRNLLTISDGNPIGDLPSTGRKDAARRGTKQTQVIEIIRGEKGVRARLVSEPVP